MNLADTPETAEQYTLYIKRSRGSLYGVVTLQRAIDGVAHKLFERLPMASGQFGYLDGGAQDWCIAKSPTPIGTHWLSLKREPLHMEPFGSPFYCLSTNKGQRTIHGPNGAMRDACGVHLENRHPGTIGCTALLHDTPERERQALALFSEFDRLYAAGFTHIRAKVFF